MWSSERLREGDVYTRAELRALFAITDATINTGIFRPTGHDSIWLFITERKPVDRTPYADHAPYSDQLSGDGLAFDGQTAGRTDPLIIAHERRGLELLLFHRRHRDEFPGSGLRYVSHSGGPPTHFVAERIEV